MTRPRQTVTHILVTQLIEHPSNVREDLGDLTELTSSVREHGILQPLIVTEHPETTERFILLAGHRRLAAARSAGLTRVPAVIRHQLDDPAEQVVVMLVENCQRRDLSAVERAEAFGALRNGGLSISEIGRRTGIHSSTISTYLNLLDLDEETREEVRAGHINSTDAIAAVREARKLDRVQHGRPSRGRPVHAERPHFSTEHPLFVAAAAICGHTTRPKVQGSLVCGTCWEAVVRADALGAPMPEPQYDEVLVQRVLDGWVGIHVTQAERVEVVRRWRASGRPLAELANRTGWKVGRYYESNRQEVAS